MSEDTPTPSQPSSESPTKVYNLKRFQMLRYDVDGSVSLELTEGKAEVFGTELIKSCPIPMVTGEKGTVLTFHGCTLAVYGQGMSAFITSTSEDQELPQVYLNIHASLETMRDTAQAQRQRGPRMLVCGLASVGKATLCKMLINYAVRQKRKPVLVDLNVGLNQVSIPSTMSALAVTKPYSMSEGWGQEEDPLVFCFGHLNSADNLNHYREQVNQLAELVNIRSENDPNIFTSGCIINMDGLKRSDTDKGASQQKGIQAIRATALAFEVDIVLVIEDGFLENFLRKDLPKEVTIIRLPKSSGVHSRSIDQWQRQRDARICAYFHGEGRKLHPHHVVLKSEMFIIYKVGTEAVPDALLRHGDKAEEESWRRPIQVSVNRNLTHCLLAVSQAGEPDGVPESPVYGFLVVVSVAEDKGSFTVLSPSPSMPPNNLLVLTKIAYVDPDMIR